MTMHHDSLKTLAAADASGGEVFDDARVVGRDEVFQHF